MDKFTVTSIVCSAVLLALICVLSVSLARSAISLERADRGPKPGTNQRSRHVVILRAKQASPFVSIACGLAYCCCNLFLQIQGSPDAEYATCIILTLVVFSGEATIVADLAYLSRSTTPPWALWLALSGVAASGIGSVALRSLARGSHALGLIGHWAPPALSSVVEGFLLTMQIFAIRTDERIVTDKVRAVVAVAIRQFGLIPYWTWTLGSNEPVLRLSMQHIQVFVLLQDPRDWFVCINGRKRVITLANRARQASRQIVPGEQAEDGESMRNLVPENGAKG